MTRIRSLLLPAVVLPTVCLAVVLVVALAIADHEDSPLVSTFSIVGFDPETGDLGVVVQSKFPNVRPVVPWARAGVGAVATQSFASLDYGIKGLDLMENGATAEEALRIVLANDENREQRQVGIVDAKGNAATWTGSEAFNWRGGRIGQRNGSVSAMGPEQNNISTVLTGYGFTAQGNILVSKETVEAMADAYQRTSGSLADRLMAALKAGGKAGGDQRGEQSAAMLVVRKGAGYDGMDNFIDISVFDHDTPIAELERLYKLNNLYFTQSREDNMIPVTAELASEIQEMWKTRGFYEGPVDGIVDTEFQQILVDYMGWENYDLRIAPVESVDIAGSETLRIDSEVLSDMRSVYKEGRWKPRMKR